MRIHKNLGHPDRLKFARLMTHAKVKPGIVKYIKEHFKCPECEATQRPKVRRPATIAKSYEFNRVLGVDVIFFTDPDTGGKSAWVNAICWGTCYSRCIYAGLVGQDFDSSSVTKAVDEGWVSIFGEPEVIVSDGGPSLRGSLWSTPTPGAFSTM